MTGRALLMIAMITMNLKHAPFFASLGFHRVKALLLLD